MLQLAKEEEVRARKLENWPHSNILPREEEEGGGGKENGGVLSLSFLFSLHLPKLQQPLARAEHRLADRQAGRGADWLRLSVKTSLLPDYVV